MNAIIPKPPKAWHELRQSDREKIEQHYKDIALTVAEEQLQKEMQIVFDSYVKMACMTLHDAMGLTEDDLIIFLANHRRMFAKQVRLIREEQQIQYLNDRMAEIFPKSGFPQEFFDRMFGED